MARKFKQAKPRSLMQLIGADYDIIMSSGTAVRGNFYWAAFVLVFIFMMTFWTVRTAVEMMFHRLFVELLLSAFFSVLFCLIYVFLLNTFSKQSIATRRKLFSLANVCRFGFVFIMAYMLSKPLEISIYKNYVDQKTIAYKGKLIESYSARMDSMMLQDKELLNAHKNRLVVQQQTYPTKMLSQEIFLIDRKLLSIQTQKEDFLSIVKDKMDASSFFVYKVRCVAAYPGGWVVCFAVLVLFLLPGYLVYSISEDDAYYKAKKAYEDDIIKNDYKWFLHSYNKIFNEQYQKDIHYYNNFVDAPFNKIRKGDYEYKPQTDFLKQFLSSE